MTVSNSIDPGVVPENARTVPLAGGGYVSTWLVTERVFWAGNPAGWNSTRLFAHWVTAAGETGGGQLSPGGLSSVISSQVAALGGGGFVIAWSENARPDDVFYLTRARIYSPSGQSVGGILVEDPFNLFRTDFLHSAAALPDGGFRVSWYSTQRRGVYSQIYEDNGARFGDIFEGIHRTREVVNFASSENDVFDISLAAVPPISGVGLTYSIHQGPFGAVDHGSLFSIDAASGAITPRFRVDYEGFMPDTSFNNYRVHQPNVYQIYVLVQSESDSVVQPIRISITDVTGETLVGTGANDSLYANIGNDWLDGGAGADLLNGGVGDDTYIVDNYRDIVEEYWDNGIDTVIASCDYTLLFESEVERLVTSDIQGSQPLRLEGSGSSNFIQGNSGNNFIRGWHGDDAIRGEGGSDTIDGGAGEDTLVGGAGNDTYFVLARDAVIEAAGGGTDTVYAGASFALQDGSHIEYLRAYAGSTGLTLTGNSFANTLVGGGGVDVLIGGAGNDIYYVQAGDSVREVADQGVDTVYTNANFTMLANASIEVLRANSGSTGLVLTGNAFANTLVGGAGADTLIGGAGNDTYYLQAGDSVIEGVGQGVETIYTTASLALQEGAEIEYLRANAGATGLALTGNGFANALVGGAGSDVLTSGKGDDTLFGLGGADIFVFQPGDGRDTIVDFQGGSGIGDRLDLCGFGFGSVSEVLAAAAQVGASTVLTLATGDVVTLRNFLSSRFVADDVML